MTTHRTAIVEDELEFLADLVPLERQQLVELGCGAAQLARRLVQRFAGTEVTGLEVDERQLARNLESPTPGLHFVRGGAEAIPLPGGRFDGALMLKSLHHVPVPSMSRALDEIARVVRRGGWLYVSEPLYGGALNELIRLFNDEREVRAAAQAALDAAIARGSWEQIVERRFDVPVQFRDFAEFEQRMMRPSWADHGIDDALLEAVRQRYAPHQGPYGAQFTRPMHARLLRRPN